MDANQHDYVDMGCLVACDAMDRDPNRASESRLHGAGFMLLAGAMFFGIATLALILIFGARFLRIFFS